MELKEKLVALRKEKGLTQSAVAEKLDVSRQAISRWESGIALPSIDSLFKMFYVLPPRKGFYINPRNILNRDCRKRCEDRRGNQFGCVQYFKRVTTNMINLLEIVIVQYGHTPPGDYYGETGGPSKDTEKYGPNKFIRMKGNQDPGYENLYVDGDYVTRGRSGLLIHGGRDQTSLWNTEGCVRIFDKDAKKITGLMDSWRSAGYHQFGRIKITRPGQSL